MSTFIVALLWLGLHTIGESRWVKRYSVDGHVSHGVNNFLGKPIADMSQTSNIFTRAGVLYEVGVLNPDPHAINASVPIESTPLDTLMASLDAVPTQQAFGFARGVGPYNIPLQDTKVVTLSSKNLTHRSKLSTYASTRGNYASRTAYLPDGADKHITLRDWNRVSSRLVAYCFPDGTSMVDIRLRNALPNAMYSAFDVGVTDAMKTTEAPAPGPLGGVANVIVTDYNGNGRLRRKLNYCLFDKCSEAKRCTVYVNIAYHFDHQNYGAGFFLSPAGPGIGVAGGNQIQFYINGKILIPVQNPFRRFFFF